MGDPAIRDYLRYAAATSPVVGSVCTGAMILAAAGLLDGRDATTHWSHHKLLERLGATYLPERWVEGGPGHGRAGGCPVVQTQLADRPELLAKLSG